MEKSTNAGEGSESGGKSTHGEQEIAAHVPVRVESGLALAIHLGDGTLSDGRKVEICGSGARFFVGVDGRQYSVSAVDIITALAEAGDRR